MVPIGGRMSHGPNQRAGSGRSGGVRGGRGSDPVDGPGTVRRIGSLADSPFHCGCSGRPEFDPSLFLSPSASERNPGDRSNGDQPEVKIPRDRGRGYLVWRDGRRGWAAPIGRMNPDGDATSKRASVRRHRRAQGGSPMRRSIRPKRAAPKGRESSEFDRPPVEQGENASVPSRAEQSAGMELQLRARTKIVHFYVRFPQRAIRRRLTTPEPRGTPQPS
jgi:hypothetical protein